MKLAATLRKNDLFIWHSPQGQRIARVLKVTQCEERDLLPEEYQKWGRRNPMIGVDVRLGRPFTWDDMPGIQVHLVTLWGSPDDQIEMYEPRRAH